MNSWANSVKAESRPLSHDLHLDLRQSITPGTRGVRELLTSALRDAVRSGRLTVGAMLPPSRTLASDLGLARNTVAEAYAELVAEGWLESRQGSGTRVVNRGQDQLPPARAARARHHRTTSCPAPATSPPFRAPTGSPPRAGR